jgi:hypothetical protein
VAARKREDGGRKQGKTWPKNGRRRRRKEIKEERRTGEKKKRISNSRTMMMWRGNTGCPNVLSVFFIITF